MISIGRTIAPDPVISGTVDYGSADLALVFTADAELDVKLLHYALFSAEWHARTEAQQLTLLADLAARIEEARPTSFRIEEGSEQPR